MPNITLYCAVSRTSLGLGDLVLENPSVGYQVVSIGPGALSWKREFVGSAYVHGQTLVGAVKENLTIPLTIRVRAPSQGVLETRVATLLRAFEQFTFNLDLTTDGSQRIWKCWAADYSPGGGSGEYNAPMTRQAVQEYNFQIPRHPTPILGAY